jgi:chromosomal replication initiator protein
MGLAVLAASCPGQTLANDSFPRPARAAQNADGADVVEQLTDIPLPGRRFTAPFNGTAERDRQVELPAFVAGPENRLVATAFGQLLDPARSLDDAADGVSRLAPAVLALFGPSGTGKTHLAHGLVRYWQRRYGDESAYYLTASDFRREYAAAIRTDSVLAFRNLVRGRQLLTIDDLDQLPADEHVVQELRYTLDAYEERGAAVVVTSHRPVTALANLSPDVRSRLSSGLMLQLATPGAAARLRIIRHISAALGGAVSDDAAVRLAQGVNGTANDLFGSLFELCTAPHRNGADDAEHAEQLLSARCPELREIISVVARYMRIPQKQLRSGSRKQSIVFPRSVAIYLARELTGASYHKIGRALGGRDHTTIMHNYRKIDDDRFTCSDTQEILDKLRRILTSR